MVKGDRFVTLHEVLSLHLTVSSGAPEVPEMVQVSQSLPESTTCQLNKRLSEVLPASCGFVILGISENKIMTEL